ncbi:MAG: HAD-IIIC family phosphatase [Clostridia bacterium]|jgi:FkbH-like protein|nr:HAD-IIIC family phosphatase [Clostridia bacterium]MBT7122440.1 HAD-IIIC family phosphatase [Clostridia bacterium]
MNELLAYPYDPELILKRKKRIKKELLSSGANFTGKKIAILGGSTTHDIAACLELFLLDHGIKPTFYESEFGQYWQDAMFGSETLDSFAPDVIYIHTSYRNIADFPTINDSEQEIDDILIEQYRHFTDMWATLRGKFHCTIIQNNFEMPFFRLLGNKDASDPHGRTNYLSRLNSMFYEYANSTDDFYINDINYLSASYGLQKWSDTFFWHMYKYSLAVPAIPHLAHNIANIIKSLYGKNKKSLVLDLDNTLWGGVVGDDGVQGIQIGHETPMGQVYSEFQEYAKAHKDLGVLLCVNSKNDHENAMEGLNHPEGTLKPDDFIVIKANWENKDQNIVDIANELNILPESLVFIDDNPVEREIVKAQVDGVNVPSVGSVETFINIIDKSGFFEVTNFSDDDKGRNDMYVANAKRAALNKTYENYEDYLSSLEMSATIADFETIYVPRITQLTNKSNQFNLTTKRYSQSEIESVMDGDNYIGLYGKLSDKFGDNGLVSIVIGRVQETALHIELWLMSCRVLKRNMEDAMMDELICRAKQRGIETIIGYYYKTAKNNMVSSFYERFGFAKTSENENGDSAWELSIKDYTNKNNVIKVES